MVVNFHIAADVMFRYEYLWNAYGPPVLGALAALADRRKAPAVQCVQIEHASLAKACSSARATETQRHGGLVEHFPVVRSVRLQADRGGPAEAGQYVVVKPALGQVFSVSLCLCGYVKVLVGLDEVLRRVEGLEEHGCEGVHWTNRRTLRHEPRTKSLFEKAPEDMFLA